MADLINATDTLNGGRLKINKGIEASERAEQKAIEIAEEVENAANGGWLKKDSVTPEKTSFIQPGKNLFDKDKRVIGYVVSDINGIISSDLGTGFDTSDFIPVVSNVPYTINKVRKLALFNADKVFISGINNPTQNPVTFTPSESGFLVFYVSQSFVNETQVEIGTSVTPYEKFSLVFTSLMTGNDNYKNRSVTNEKIGDATITYEKINPDSRIPIKKVGKNLFNLNGVTSNYYVNYQTGSLVANSSLSASGFIDVFPLTDYTLSIQHPTENKNISQLAYYDENKIYISGVANSGVVNSVALKTPANARFIRLSLTNDSIQYSQFEKGSKSKLEPFQIKLPGNELATESLTNEIIANETITDAKINPESKIALKKVGKNLYNVNTTVDGFYANYATGGLTVNADSSASDFIAVKPETNYTHSNIGNPVEQLAWYNAEKTYISGVTNSGVKDSVILLSPPNAKFVRITAGKAIKNTVQFQEGTELTAFEEFVYAIPAKDIQKRNFDLSYFTHEALQKLGADRFSTVVTVKKDGKGDFTTLREAIEATSVATSINRFDIELYEGVYDMLEEYTEAEINEPTFIGFKKLPFVSWTGVGDKHKIIVKNEFPDTEEIYFAATKLRVGTICTLGTGDLTNFTATAKNNRYAVHDDYKYFRTRRTVTDCRFIKKKGLGSIMGGKQAWGEGSWSGMKSIFKNTEFITEYDYYAFTSHNNVDFDEPSSHIFYDCKLITTMGNSIRFESLNSGQVDVVEMYGTHMNGGVVFSPHVDYTDKNDYVLKGHSNDVIPVDYRNTDGVHHSYEFVGETRELYNGNAFTIKRGTPVMIQDIIMIKPVTNDVLYYGIADEDIPANSRGIVKHTGYYPIAYTGLSGLVLGDKIGVVNGILSKITSGDYIGIVTMAGYIKLK